MDLTAMFAMFIIFGLPVLALTATILGISGMWYRFKLRELETRHFEATTRLHQARLLAGAPDWIDPANPADVEAWQKANHEVIRAGARAHARIGVGEG